jgi:nucleoside-diphosphate-sugar epimerase
VERGLEIQEAIAFPMNPHGKKRIAITGASGFVGKYLCEHLVGQGHDVLAVVRDVRHEFPTGVTLKFVPKSSDWLANDIFQGCDVVIHLVGRAHVLNETAENPLDEFRKTNVDIVLPLMSSASKAGVKRVVFVSTIGVNGKETKAGPYVETDEERPHNPYSVTKLEAEHALKRRAGDYGIEYVVVRPVLVFGPGAPGNFGSLLRLARTNVPLPFKNLGARRNLVSIWNLVAFLELCATHAAAANELFLVADDETTTLPEILKELRIGMGKKPMIWPMPVVILKAAMFLLGKKRSFEKLEQELLVDAVKARTILNWRPTFHTVEALRKTGSVYRKKTS